MIVLRFLDSANTSVERSHKYFESFMKLSFGEYFLFEEIFLYPHLRDTTCDLTVESSESKL